MAGYKRYRKDSPVSYALGITLTFELLRFQPDKVTRVYIHSGMKEGETLTKISLRFYGTKALWPYIVKYNRELIKNPDNVPSGVTIKIPDLIRK